MTHTYDYCSNLVYDDEELSFIIIPGGRAIPDGEIGYLYEYFLRDHHRRDDDSCWGEVIKKEGIPFGDALFLISIS